MAGSIWWIAILADDAAGDAPAWWLSQRALLAATWGFLGFRAWRDLLVISSEGVRLRAWHHRLFPLSHVRGFGATRWRPYLELSSGKRIRIPMFVHSRAGPWRVFFSRTPAQTAVELLLADLVKALSEARER